MELKKPLTHTAGDRAGSGLEVTIPFGVIDAPEKASVGDGLIEKYSLSQDVAAARLSVRFAKPGLKWRVRELDAPRRLAVEVSIADFEAIAPQAPAPVPPAPAQASTGAMPVPVVPVPPARAKRLIIIDAGHGGKDGGASGTRSTREKDINLAAAKELVSLLGEENLFDVVMTRSNDTFIPLAERSRIANDGKADLFVSLHCNAHRNKRERGFEVYFLSENASDPEAERLAQVENSVVALEGKSPADEEAALILHAMSKTENINDSSELAALVSRSLSRRTDLTVRGVKQAGFFVLRGTDAPAILVEMAFLTNRDDEAKLRTARYRRRMVDGVYAGILEYAKRRHWLEKSP
jgi:N-acetylmuramoyl-L-alanine amidase